MLVLMRLAFSFFSSLLLLIPGIVVAAADISFEEHEELRTRSLRFELAIEDWLHTNDLPDQPLIADSRAAVRDRQAARVRMLRAGGQLHAAGLLKARLESGGVYLPYSAQDRLALADDAYRRGDYLRATELLRAALSTRPRETAPAIMDLYLRILLAQGRNAEAADWVIAQRSADLQTPYTRFNLAVALMRAGREKAAVSLLYRLGRAPAVDAESHAIRDQANLALGWHFLAQEFGGSAKAAFRQVSLRGPQSNAALLGIGWAELAPQGKRQYRDYVGDEASPVIVTDLSPALIKRFAERRLIEPELALLYDPMVLPTYPSATLSSDEQTALGRAAVAWKELQARDPHDPFVWEAWIALPYALDKAGATAQAIEHYRLAITRLEAQESALDVYGARFDSLLAELLAESAQLGWWSPWLTGSEAQLMLVDLREAGARRETIAVLANKLQTAVPGIAGADTDLVREAEVLQREWTAFALQREASLRMALRRQMQLRTGLLRTYRQSAHLALARLLDRDPASK